jgi:hypothetical protein
MESLNVSLGWCENNKVGKSLFEARRCERVMPLRSIGSSMRAARVEIAVYTCDTLLKGDWSSRDGVDSVSQCCVNMTLQLSAN